LASTNGRIESDEVDRGPAMTFDEVFDQAIAMFQRWGSKKG
jgi:hypothetical protein